MNFDADRKGTGTAEWAEVTENICRGCANNCLYCYAAHNANRFNQRPRAKWEREEFTKRAAMTSYPARDGVVMFPSSHDITPFNLDAYIRVAKLILGKGNKLLIVTKPRWGCVSRLITELDLWRSQILLRFTMGTINGKVSEYWEPGASCPLERGACLKSAFESRFATSVSIEPMLEGAQGAIAVVESCRPFVTDTIWIGKMNKARLRVGGEHALAVAITEQLQRDEEIMWLYRYFQDDPIIRWKDSIKEVVARAL
jgi:DNA repair photolyase